MDTKASAKTALARGGIQRGAAIDLDENEDGGLKTNARWVARHHLPIGFESG